MKLTFQSDTFGSFAFRADTWAGSRIRDMFCRSFTTQADFLEFVEDFNAAIANPAQLSAADKAFLDLYDDGVVGYDDRDAWLHYLLTVNPPGLLNGRLPYSNPADSDPLGLRGSLPNVIIIDPQNTNAVKVTRATNDVTDQAGGSLGLLWDSASDNSYNFTLWYDLNSLDEMNRVGFGGSTIRRFPTNRGEIYIYVRGGSQTLDQGSIGLCRNNTAWTKPTRIVIRNYPGETVTLKCGSKLITSGPGAGQYDIRFEGGGQFQFRNRRSNVTWEGVTFRGYRDSGNARIYCVAAYYVEQDDPDGSAVQNCTFRKMQITDLFGISPTHPQAGTYPHYVDTGWDRFDEVFNQNVDSETAPGILAGSVIYSNGQNTKVIQCRLQSAPADFPITDAQRGEGLFINLGATNSLISRCTMDGLSPHAAITIGGQGTICEFNTIANYHDTCIGFGNSNVTIRYNRCSVVSHQAKIAVGIQVTPNNSTASGRIHGNVIWGFQFDGLPGLSNSGISLLRGIGGTGTIDGVEVDHNIFFGAGLMARRNKSVTVERDSNAVIR